MALDKTPVYPTTTTEVGDLTIVDHSAKFEIVNPIEEELTRNSHTAIFNFMPGSRRDVEYTIGRVGVSLNVKVVDAHPQGNPDASVQLLWDARIAPYELAQIVLRMTETRGQCWEYVDYPDDWPMSGASFPRLTEDVAEKVRAKGRPINRLNTDDMSLLGRDVNGQKDKSKPEVASRYGLGLAGAGEFMTRLIEQTAHEDLVRHLPTIISRETEAFS